MTPDTLLMISVAVTAALVAIVALLCTRLYRLQARYRLIHDAEAEAQRLTADAQRDAVQIRLVAQQDVQSLRREIEDGQKRGNDLVAKTIADANRKAEEIIVAATQELGSVREQVEDERKQRDVLVNRCWSRCIAQPAC